MPSKRALPPVEYCLGSSQAANSRPFRKAAPFADRRNDGCGYDRPNSWNLLDATATGIGISDGFQLITEHLDLLLDHPPLFPEQFQKIAHLRRQIVLRVLQ